MIDEKTKMAIALKRFSLISPIINGQVTNISEYINEATRHPIEMPHYGTRRYAPRTLSVWYSDYIQGGVEALKPSPRSDRGEWRTLLPEMCESILEKIREFPKAPATIIYDMLLDEGAFLKKDVSIATVRRFIKVNRTDTEEGATKTQMLRFTKEFVNQLWETDVMYGPYVGTKKKKITYLLAYIDDCSRLVTHAEFYLSQSLESLRSSFRDAVLRRGIPSILYTDNGSIYRSQSFEYLCANVGVALLHHAVAAAHQKGKIERFFRTVRLRFLSVLKQEDLESIDSLNKKFAVWLHEDYQTRPHNGISGETPLDFFLKQADRIQLVTDLAEFNKKLLISVKRTVKKDATISFDNSLYETDMVFAGERLDVKYDPDNKSGVQELLLFRENQPVGVARLVNFADNSKRKRFGSAATIPSSSAARNVGNTTDELHVRQKENTISYSDAMGGD
jgi:transposase InsO family protein